MTETSADIERRKARRVPESGDVHRKFVLEKNLGLLGQVKDGVIPVAEAAQQITNRELYLESQAMRDSLTGALSRGAIFYYLSKELREATRDGTKVGVVMLDLDRFKQINDVEGHPKGDEVLKGMVRIVREVLDELGGEIGRYGGEEFVIVVPLASEDALERIASRVGIKIAMNLATQAEVRSRDRVTASFGACLARQGEGFDEVIVRTDRLLYEAKGKGEEGRARLVWEDSRGEVKYISFR